MTLFGSVLMLAGVGGLTVFIIHIFDLDPKTAWISLGTALGIIVVQWVTQWFWIGIGRHQESQKNRKSERQLRTDLERTEVERQKLAARVQELEARATTEPNTQAKTEGPENH